jgi:putative transposase
LRELSSEQRRFGYRRLHLLLKREGIAVNWKKLYRIYKEERLTVRKRGGRKRALGTRSRARCHSCMTSSRFAGELPE